MKHSKLFLNSLLLCLSFAGCTTLTVAKPKVNVSPDICKQKEIVVEFIPMITANDIVINVHRSLAYIKALQQALDNQEQCYNKVIESLNGN